MLSKQAKRQERERVEEREGRERDKKKLNTEITFE